MLDRRRFIGAVALTFAAVPFTSEAQPAKIPRIGIVVNGSRTALSAQDDAFRRSLRNLGWIDGNSRNRIGLSNVPGRVLQNRILDRRPRRLGVIYTHAVS